MKNKHQFGKIVNTLKSLCFSPNLIPIYIVMGAMFLLLNVLFIPGLFRAGSEGLGTDFVYIIFLVFASVGILFFTVISVPIYLKKGSEKAEDDVGADVPVYRKILSVWIPFCVCTLAQMLIFALCALISGYFVLPFVNILLTCISLCVLYLEWILLLAFLNYCSGSVLWYVVGFLTVNFAPVIIIGACHDIYSMYVPGFDLNYLTYNVFALTGMTILTLDVMIITAVILVGILVCMWLLWKKRREIKQSVFSTIYKMAVIFLVSLSAGVMVSSSFMRESFFSSDYVICFAITALAVAVLFSFFAFRKTNLIVPVSVTVSAVFVSSVLILEGIPAMAHKEAYYLPEPEEVEGISLFLDSNHTLEIKQEHFDECIALNKFLLDKFEQGYLPEAYPGSGESNGIVDRWDQANFKYVLKDGERVYKYYNHFYDPVFDELYIELYRSGIYTDYLQNVRNSRSEMRYYINGGDERGNWCESLPKEYVDTLIDVYCEELMKAEDAAFYEEYELIAFSDCGICVPLSFTETRKLAKEYVDKYCKY